MNDTLQVRDTGAIAQESIAVLDFWFGAADEAEHGLPRKAWFDKDIAFDDEIRRRFRGIYDRALAGEFESWGEHGRSCLALILVFDQFPRNMFRSTPAAFATDARALALARHAVARGYDRCVPPVLRMFFYLPFEHSEALADQNEAVRLFESVEPHPGRDEGIRYAVAHREIIARFGRFPHRTAILGRRSTPEELAFLQTPNSSF
jgi:uncharacterized protein (DUF924 family)